MARRVLEGGSYPGPPSARMARLLMFRPASLILPTFGMLTNYVDLNVKRNLYRSLKDILTPGTFLDHR